MNNNKTNKELINERNKLMQKNGLDLNCDVIVVYYGKSCYWIKK